MIKVNLNIQSFRASAVLLLIRPQSIENWKWGGRRMFRGTADAADGRCARKEQCAAGSIKREARRAGDAKTIIEPLA